jgi:hypothetical protein
MGQPEGQIQYYTREQVTGASGASVPSLSGLTDISFLSSDNSINSTSTNFKTSGYEAGMLIAISGSLQNDKNFLIFNVTANKLKVVESSVAPEAAGHTIAISAATVLRANQGNVSNVKKFERAFICTICNQSFGESQMRYFRGRWYCLPNGDYKDIASILKREWAAGYKPAGLGTERIVPPIIKG